MNNGLFGFFVGANVTIDVQEFDSTNPTVDSGTDTSVWRKPKNAQLCFIEGTGGGQAGGGSAGTASNRLGGQAGVAYQIILNASELNNEELVVIGAGGQGAQVTTGATGGNTTFAGFVWAGGINHSSGGRHPLLGSIQANGWGTGGASASPIQGGHGGFGAGGGGRGLGAGGKPRSFQFTANATNCLKGDGAAAGTSADPAKDRDGFGEGGGGGSGAALPGNGRRGSGGGGASSTQPNTNGGNGGDGFLRVITYCWE